MCEKCFERAEELFPDMTEGDRTHILLHWTDYPDGCAKDVIRQLEKYAEELCGT